MSCTYFYISFLNKIHNNYIINQKYLIKQFYIRHSYSLIIFSVIILKLLVMDAKIKVNNPVVEMDGDEMTRVI